jgi:hypothetical protein
MPHLVSSLCFFSPSSITFFMPSAVSAIVLHAAGAGTSNQLTQLMMALLQFSATSRQNEDKAQTASLS